MIEEINAFFFRIKVILSSTKAAKEICQMEHVTERVLNSFMATRAYEDKDLGKKTLILHAYSFCEN